MWRPALAGPSGAIPAPLRDFDYVGAHRYFVTWCCFERRPLFSERLVVERATAQILRACEPSGIAVIAYCFMPDHLHMLVAGVDPRADGRRFFRLAKQYAGFAHSKMGGGRLWQRYGYEHVVRSTQKSRAVARYILENPVRAGLASAAGDWPFSGAPTTNQAALIEWAYSNDEWSG